MDLTLRVAARYRVAQAFLKKGYTYAEALDVLDFPNGARPTEAEVNLAYRAKVRDVIKADPEAAKDQEAMKPFNMAKDTLTGQLTPDRDRGAPQDVDTGGGYSGGRRAPTPPPAEEKTSFLEAKAQAKIPSDVKWLFVTDSQHSGYSSDEFTNSTNGWVACGQTDSHWVYVTAEHHYYRAYGPNGYFSLNEKQTPKDIWDIETLKIAKKDPVPTAAELYKGVVKAWGNFKRLDKKFNSKVVEAKDWAFHEKLPTGRKITIKQLVSNETGVEFTGKMSVEVVYEESRERGDKTPAGFFSVGEYSTPYQLQLVINGREHTLSVADMEVMHKTLRVSGKRFVERVFGEYPHQSRPKSLTLNRDGKLIMAWMAEKLPHLPDWVREALVKAATPPAAGAAKKPTRRYGHNREAVEG